MSTTEDLRRLIDRAKDAMTRKIDTFDHEPEYVAVLKHLQGGGDTPEARAIFVEMVRSFSYYEHPDKRPDIELVAFCMRALRWPEVRRAAQEQKDKEQTIDAQDKMNIVLDAYLPGVWNRAELYKTYEHESDPSQRQ